MGEPSGAVFLSYASEDSEAAQHIAEALKVGGIEVWLDKTELRGGDVWDQAIQRQIRERQLSRHTLQRARACTLDHSQCRRHAALIGDLLQLLIDGAIAGSQPALKRAARRIDLIETQGRTHAGEQRISIPRL